MQMSVLISVARLELKPRSALWYKIILNIKSTGLKHLKSDKIYGIKITVIVTIKREDIFH